MLSRNSMVGDAVTDAVIMYSGIGFVKLLNLRKGVGCYHAQLWWIFHRVLAQNRNIDHKASSHQEHRGD